jgi:hypothetical protein
MRLKAIFTMSTVGLNIICGIFYSQMGIIRRIIAEGLSRGGIERPGYGFDRSTA